jgi:DNA-binding phage protein
MAEIRQRIHRRLTETERGRHRIIRAQIEQEKSAIQARGRAAMETHDHLQQALQALKAAREQRGLSLTEMSRRSGIDRARLSRLETDAHANPTLETLSRMAQALDVELRITVVEPVA